MKRIIPVLLLVLIFLIQIEIHAGISKVGQTGFKFLDVSQGARPTAMGEAYTVIGDDAISLFYNPAGIAKVNKRFEISVSITDWISDVSYNSLAAVYNTGKWGVIGLSMLSPDYGPIPGTRVSLESEEGFIETGRVDVGAFSLGIAYARSITEKFSIGAQVKYASQKLGSSIYEVDGEIHENKISSLGYDLGFLFYPRFTNLESFGLGMYVANFSPDLRYEEYAFQMPLTFNVGVSMDVLDLFGEHPDNSFLIAFDVVHPRDFGERFHLGAEYTYNNMVSARMGYKFNYDEEGLTLGIGLYRGGINISYSYGDFGTFNMMNRISLGLGF